MALATILVCGIAQAQTYVPCPTGLVTQNSYTTPLMTPVEAPEPKTAIEAAWHKCIAHAPQDWGVGSKTTFDWSAHPDFQKPCEQVKYLWNRWLTQLQDESDRKEKEYRARRDKEDMAAIERAIKYPDEKP